MGVWRERFDGKSLVVFFLGDLRLGRAVGTVTGSDLDFYSHSSDVYLLPFNEN